MQVANRGLGIPDYDALRSKRWNVIVYDQMPFEGVAHLLLDCWIVMGKRVGSRMSRVVVVVVVAEGETRTHAPSMQPGPAHNDIDWSIIMAIHILHAQPRLYVTAKVNHTRGIEIKALIIVIILRSSFWCWKSNPLAYWWRDPVTIEYLADELLIDLGWWQ